MIINKYCMKFVVLFFAKLEFPRSAGRVHRLFWCVGPQKMGHYFLQTNLVPGALAKTCLPSLSRLPLSLVSLYYCYCNRRRQLAGLCFYRRLLSLLSFLCSTWYRQKDKAKANTQPQLYEKRIRPNRTSGVCSNLHAL